MQKVLLYSFLLVAGLIGSQLLPGVLGTHNETWMHAVKLLTMAGLAFIMIHVGYEFELDKSNLRQYGWDSVVAATAAVFPWLCCAAYFMFAMTPAGEWGSYDRWRQSLLSSLFSAPTSAGVLFSMLAAAGLSATWVFRKARVLAVFDDLDTVLLMIPLKMLIVGLRWQLVVVVLVMLALLWAAWRYLRAFRLPITWPWVLGYAIVIALASEGIYASSKLIDEVVPVHLEVLLPAFVLGCTLRRPAGHDPHRDDAREGHAEGPESATEQRVSTIVSAAFMVLVGLSMPLMWQSAPTIAAGASDQMGWAAIALHVVLITILSNVGKMFPALCYRREVSLRERLALSVAMFPRGEVGAGVLVLSLSYGIAGPKMTVALLSLTLNLLCTGVFIVVVKRLLRGRPDDAVVSALPG